MHIVIGESCDMMCDAGLTAPPPAVEPRDVDVVEIDAPDVKPQEQRRRLVGEDDRAVEPRGDGSAPNDVLLAPREGSMRTAWCVQT